MKTNHRGTETQRGHKVTSSLTQCAAEQTVDDNKCFIIPKVQRIFDAPAGPRPEHVVHDVQVRSGERLPSKEGEMTPSRTSAAGFSMPLKRTVYSKNRRMNWSGSENGQNQQGDPEQNAAGHDYPPNRPWDCGSGSALSRELLADRTLLNSRRSSSVFISVPNCSSQSLV